MRTILLGLAGLALASCGQADGEATGQNNYGAKPSERETVDQTGGDGGEAPANQEITGTPTGMSGGGPEGGTDGGPSDGSMSQNQSQPMQAAQ